MVKLVTILVLSISLMSCGKFKKNEEDSTSLTARSIPGPEGEQGEQGERGRDGRDGKDGQDGVDGKEAEPCSVIQHSDGATITCPDGTVAEIYHGSNGQDGSNGVDGKDGTDGADGADGQNGVDGQDGIDNTEPVYVGYFCYRTVLRLGGIHYIINGSLIPLNSAWLQMSSNCKVRYKNNKVQEKRL